MKTLVSIVLLTLLAICAWGQTATPVQVSLFAGPNFDGHKVGATLGGAYPFSPTTSGGLAADLAFRPHALPQTNIRGFFEWKAGTVGGLPVILTQDVGAAFAASDPTSAVEKAGSLVQSVLSNVGTNIGYLAATGVRTDIPIGKGFVLQPRARIAKGSLNDTGVVFALTLASKVTVSK